MPTKNRNDVCNIMLHILNKFYLFYVTVIKLNPYGHTILLSFVGFQIKYKQDMILEPTPSVHLSTTPPPHSKTEPHQHGNESWWSLIPIPQHIPSVQNSLSIPCLIAPHSLKLISSQPLNFSFFVEPSLITSQIHKIAFSRVLPQPVIACGPIFSYCIFICMFDGLSTPLEYKPQESMDYN